VPDVFLLLSSSASSLKEYRLISIMKLKDIEKE